MQLSDRKRRAFVTVAVTILLAGCGGQPDKTEPAKDKKIAVAYVTNCIASFWVIAEKGVVAAGKELGVETHVRMPTKGAEDQRRMLQELITNRIDGIAVSPIDPDNQTDILNECAAQTNLITQDSDAPKTKRLCYIGMNNYDAGRMCGKLVRQAIPKGGNVMIFVGRLGQLNAKLRRQGVIDEVLGRSHDASRYDEPGKPVSANGYTIVDTRTDQMDFAKAKSQAQEAIAKYSDLHCMVGLFAYNPPKILEAVKEANKLDQIKIVGFDEEDGTLQGIKEGHIIGTVVQNPYKYGYESVRILNALAKKDMSVIPANRFIDIPARTITKDNVVEFWDELKKLTSPNSN